MGDFKLPPMDAELPFDPAVRRGRLNNGLSYYVRHNTMPHKRAELRLVVRAGSVLEGDDERGVAHIVEHLAFRKTEKFDNFALVKFLESIGAKFGACQNAYTSMDQTVYELHVPIDEAGFLEQSLQILQQWAFKIEIDAEGLDQERTIVLEEWRQGKNAASRASKSHFKDMMRPSKYEKRLPIGTKKSIMGVPVDIVKAFYKRWYHPDNMAIVVVGDIDADKVVSMVEEIFDSEPRPDPLTKKPVVECPVHEDVRVSVMPDAETTSHAVMVDCTRPRQFVRSALDYRRLTVDDLFQIALNVRFQKIMMQVDPPFVDCQVASSLPVTMVESANLTMVCNEGGALRALEAGLTEVVRMRVHGVDDNELEMCKADLLADMETQRLEKDQWESDYHASRHVSHFISGEPVLDAEYDVALSSALLKGITNDDIKQAAANFSFNRNTVVKITRPAPSAGILSRIFGMSGSGGSSGGQSVETLSEVAAAIHRVEELHDSAVQGDANIDEWVMAELPDVLVETPTAGSTVSRKKMQGTHCGEVTEVVLSNGVTMSFRSTDFLDDEVRFSATALGGLTEVPEENLIEARHASSIANEVGVYGVVPEVWVDVMAGKRSSVSHSMSLYGRYIGGECSPVDLEFTMQCLRLLFTAKLQPDVERLRTALRVIVEAAQNRHRDPRSVFSRRVVEINTGAQQARFFRPVSVDQARAINPNVAIDIFQKAFSDPSEFKFVFVGHIDIESTIQLAETYIASIPTPGRSGGFYNYPTTASDRYVCSPVPMTFPTHSVVEQMRLPMVQAYGVAQLTYPLHIEHDRKLEDAHWLAHVEQALERRLMERLRFNDSAVYSVNCSSDFDGVTPNVGVDWEGMMYTYFTCDPSEAMTLCQAAMDELRRLAAEGPTEEEVKAVVETQTRQFQEAYDTNSFWCGQYAQSYRSARYAGCLVDTVDRAFETRLKICDSMTPQSLQAAVRRLVPNADRHTLVTLGPQRQVCGFPAITVAGVVVCASALIGGLVALRRRD